MIFDSHAHYDDEAFDKDRDRLLSTLEEQGVGCIVNVGASFQGAKDSVELSMRYPHVYAAVGVHPDHVGELDEAKMQQLREMCAMKKTVAVGEIGLDYYWDKESHELQKEWFERQMELAKEVDLPIIVHSREAAQDTFDLIKSEHAGTTGGVIHCFSGSKEMAKEYIKMGYYIGFTGTMVFPKSTKLKRIAAELPIDRILIETDCPYLTPPPYRGKRNEPAYVQYVADEIARLRGMTTEEVRQITLENGKRIFGITGDEG